MKNAREKMCVGCGQHRALFVYKGRAKYSPDHDLCPRCFRSALGRLKSKLLKEENFFNRESIQAVV